LRRVTAVLCVGVVFAASAAIALGQDNGGDEGQPGAGVTVTFPDSLEGRDEAYQRAVEFDHEQAPPGTEPGPTIEPDEVHIPDEPPVEFFVNHCNDVISNGAEALNREPLCRAVILMDAGQLPGGVYPETEIEARYNQLVGEEN